MRQIEGIQERGGHGHGAVEARAAFLPTLKREDRGLEIHPIGGQGQGLRRPTARIQQRLATGTDLARGCFGGSAESRPLGADEIEAVTLGVIDLHTSGGAHGVPFCSEEDIDTENIDIFGKNEPKIKRQ